MKEIERRIGQEVKNIRRFRGRRNKGLSKARVADMATARLQKAHAEKEVWVDPETHPDELIVTYHAVSWLEDSSPFSNLSRFVAICDVLGVNKLELFLKTGLITEQEVEKYVSAN